MCQLLVFRSSLSLREGSRYPLDLLAWPPVAAPGCWLVTHHDDIIFKVWGSRSRPFVRVLAKCTPAYIQNLPKLDQSARKRAFPSITCRLAWNDWLNTFIHIPNVTFSWRLAIKSEEKNLGGNHREVEQVVIPNKKKSKRNKRNSTVMETNDLVVAATFRNMKSSVEILEWKISSQDLHQVKKNKN